MSDVVAPVFHLIVLAHLDVSRQCRLACSLNGGPRSPPLCMAAFAIILVTRCEATPGWPGDPSAVHQRDCGPVEISASLGSRKRVVPLQHQGGADAAGSDRAIQK